MGFVALYGVNASILGPKPLKIMRDHAMVTKDRQLYDTREEKAID